MGADSETVHAAAVHFLLEGKNHEAANVLLSCDVQPVWVGWYSESDSFNDQGGIDNAYKVVLGTHYALAPILKDRAHPITAAICAALEAALLTYPMHEGDQSLRDCKRITFQGILGSAYEEVITHG